MGKLRTLMMNAIIVCFLTLTSFAPVIYADPPFGLNVRVSDIALTIDHESKWDPSIAADSAGNLYVVWEDERDMYRDIYFAKSTDGGNTFSVNKKISDDLTTSSQTRPSIAVDDTDNIYVVWQDYRNGTYDIYFTKSIDGGNTFSASKKVNDVNPSAGSYTPTIAAYGNGNISIAWKDYRNDANGDIYFSNSTDGGQTFSANIKVNDDLGSNSQSVPSITVDNTGNTYIVWTDDRLGDDDIYFSNSTDGGNSFSPNKKVDDGGVGTLQYNPSIAADGEGIIYIAWQDNQFGDFNIHFSNSTDGGKTFSPDKRVTDDMSGTTQRLPCITVSDAGDVYIVWEDSRNGNYDIYFTKSTDGGDTFSPNKKVNNDVGTDSQCEPFVAAFGVGDIYVVWQDYRNGELDIYFANSTDGGDTFSPNKKINDGIRDAWRYLTSIAVDDEANIFIVWADDRRGDWDIYFANSTDGGNTFSDSKRVNDDVNIEFHWSPSIALDSSGNIYIVWEDQRNGGSDPDIYFTKSTDGGNTFSANIKVNDDTGTGQTNPSIAIDDSDNIYVIWEDYRNLYPDVYLADSTDGGATFSPNRRVNDDVPVVNRKRPSIVADGTGNLYIAFYDNRNGNHDIYFTSSTDGGYTFSTDMKVNDDVGDDRQWGPQLTVDDAGTLYIAWWDERNGDSDVYFANSTDGGNTFSPNEKVNDDMGTASPERVSIAADGVGEVYLVWEDDRNGDWDIYFASSIDGGNTFSTNSRVNYDVVPTSQISPSMALDLAGNVYVAWNDRSEGNFHIFFSTTAFKIYEIQVINITDIAAMITWKTNKPANSTIDYGLSNTYGSTIQDNSMVTTHIIELTGLEPGRLYHFRVTSFNNSYNYNMSKDFTFTTKFSIDLEPGWNMISLPLNQTDTNLENVLESIDGDYDIVEWYDVTHPYDSWEITILGKPFGNDLTKINRYIGIWIHIINPTGTTLYVNGTAPEVGYVNQITLHGGWNFVGYPSLIERAPPFELPPGVCGVQWYNATSGLWENWDPGTYLDPDTLSLMKPGQGLWVYYKGPSTVWNLEYVN